MANPWDNDAVLSVFDAALAREGVSGKLGDVARSIYQQESGSGKNSKTSNAGAVGGMQIIPSTFASVADKGWDINDPMLNARAGIRYLKQLDEQSGGNPALTAAGYYGGPSGLEKARKGIAVSDPRNPNAPNTLQYGQQVAARLPKNPVVNALDAVTDAVMPSANASQSNWWDKDEVVANGKTGIVQDVKQGVGNVLAGAVRGAGSIGATLLSPFDAAARAVNGGKPLTVGGYDVIGQDRRAGMDAGLQSMGAELDSYMFKGGKIASEIAGTAGAGGVVAQGIGRVAPAAVAGSPRLAQALQAVRSGGFALGGTAATGLAGRAADLGVRAAGGAVSGAAQAGMVDPGEIGVGALIGGALPVGVKGLGAAADGLGNFVRQVKRPAETRLASKLAQSLGMTSEELSAAVSRQGPSMLPGYQETVPQILQNPITSQLQRTLKTAGANALGDAERVQQGQMRAALERVAPIDLSVQDAAARAGSAIENYALPAEQSARQKVGALFDAIPSDEAMMQLPLQKMQEAQMKFLGAGTFGKGGALVEQAMDTATGIGFNTSELTFKAVPFDQLQNLRSSVSEAIAAADKNGQAQAKAALTQIKNSIDNKVGEVASGIKQPGEVFTPQAIDAWGQALNAHSAKKLQFNTGPQSSIFRQGGDSQAAIQGAEIPGKFFSGRRSQVEDVKSLNRLIGDNPSLLRDMKGYAVTEGASTANAAEELTSKYTKWLNSRSGANRELFTAQENATLGEVGKAVTRGLKAENLGRVSGSDTAQKLEALNNLGLLDSKIVNILGSKIPFVGSGLKDLRETAGQTRNNALAKLLANPDDLAKALKPGTPQSNALLGYMNRAGAISSNVLPVLSAQ